MSARRPWLLTAPSPRRIKAPSLKTYLSSLHSFCLLSRSRSQRQADKLISHSFPRQLPSNRSAPSKTLRAFLESAVPPGCLWMSAPASRHSQPCLEHLQAKVPGGWGGCSLLRQYGEATAHPSLNLSQLYLTFAGRLSRDRLINFIARLFEAVSHTGDVLFCLVASTPEL